MALAFGDRAIHPFTVDDVLQMLEAGILPEDNRLELLHGVLTEKAVPSSQHRGLKWRLFEWLQGDGRRVFAEDGVVVPDRLSLPEPDIAVVPPGEYLHDYPTTALLVIEVALSSLRTDLGVKPALYASMDVPDYWVVDVDARRVHVHRDSTPTGYASITTHGPTGALQPLNVDVEPLDLEALFAGLR